MPSNRSYPIKCLNGLLRTFKRKPQVEKDYIEFLENVLNKDQARAVPKKEISAGGDFAQVWYVAHLGVYHPKKQGQIRVVFDSSSEYQKAYLLFVSELI